MPTVIKGFTQRALRWPLLFAVILILAFELFWYCLIRLCVISYEWFGSIHTRHAGLKRRMRDASTFVEWCRAARELDQAEGRDAWKLDPAWPYYDPDLLSSHLGSLRRHRSDSDHRSLMRNLKTIYSLYNFGGMSNYQLYNQTHFGTKLLVHDFIQEVLECTILIRDDASIPIATRREWFRRVRKSYGRTALLLSGGAAMGYYHVGVLKALWESKCLPSIVSGASAGSLMCGYLAVRTDEELAGLFTPECHRLFRACAEPWSVKVRRWLRKGYLFDVNDWMVKLRRDMTKGDTTFAEAFAMTGRTVNITITSVSKYVPSIILNYKTTPDVLIWSAILASSAMPNMVQPVELLCKDREGHIRPFHVHGKTWTDGTIKNDVPVKEIAAMHNANFFIVSQVNPHLVPFFYTSRGSTGRPSQHSSGSGYRGGFILSAAEKLLKLDMRKWLQLLSELDLLPVVFGTDWRFIFLQPVSGTVTIVPAAPIGAYLRVLTDPTYDTMADYIRIGEKATWNKLARISNHYRLERLINDCKRALDQQKDEGEEERRRSLQRDVRSMRREQKQKERWSSEEDEKDRDRDKDSAQQQQQRAAGGGVQDEDGDESMLVEKVGEIDTAKQLRRASIAKASREIERQVKRRVVEEELHKEAGSGLLASPIVGASSRLGLWTGGDGVTETESVSAGGKPEAGEGVVARPQDTADLAPPVVYGDEGEAYLTDAGDTDDDDDDSLPPASPLRNM